MATITLSITSGPVIASKTWTGTDQDMTDILAWAAVVFNPQIQAIFNSSNNPAFVPTNTQIAATIAQAWMNSVKDAVQRFKTPAVVVPPQITMA